jgi:hypothetical protein
LVAYESVRSRALPPPSGPPQPFAPAEPAIHVVLAAAEPVAPAPASPSSAARPDNGSPLPEWQPIAHDPIANERGDLIIEELDGRMPAAATESVDLDLGVEPSRYRALKRGALAVAAALLVTSGIAFLRRTNDPTRSGRGVIERLRTQGPATMKLATSTTSGAPSRYGAVEGTFDIGKAQADFTLHQGPRAVIAIRRDARKLYFSSPGSDWQVTSLRTAFQGQSLLDLIVLPTDVVALVGLVPAEGFVDREEVDLDGDTVTHATFSVTPVANPVASLTNDVMDGERLLDALDDLKGPLAGEVWFDAQHRLRKAVVRATGKSADREVEYTVTLADFGKPFELSIPIVSAAAA